MSRPKGSKNKPKLTPIESAAIPTPEKKTRKPRKAKAPEVKPASDKHIFLQFVDYAIERFDGIELAYFKRQANKTGRTVPFVVASAFMDFFRIRDSQIDLSKLLESK